MKQKPKHTPARIKCPYCGRSAVLRKASYVYQEKALDEYLYVCTGYPKCDAYVGVHAGTMRPKGDAGKRRPAAQADRNTPAV